MNRRYTRGIAGWVTSGLLWAVAGAAGAVTVGDYDALTNAIAMCSDGDTISLTNDITVSTQVSISTKGLTLEGNHYTISVPVPSLDESGFGNANVSSFRVFNIDAIGKTNTLRNMTVKGGNPDGAGGGIWKRNGVLVLEGVSVTQSGGSGHGGGGVANDSGKFFMRDCTISHNIAYFGGGFLNYGQMFIERCTLSDNRCMRVAGGGAGENDMLLYANNSTFANNVCNELGGAINNYGGTAYFVGCTFVANMAYGTYSGGAIANNGGTVTLVNSLFAYNYHNSGGTYLLNDINNFTGTAPVAYGCVFQSTTNQLGAGSVGTMLYTGNDTGSDDALFTGGAAIRVRAEDGTETGTDTFYLPILTRAGSSQTPTALLKPGSFAIGKGVRTAFSSATETPVVGYYNGSAWVDLSGSNSASYEVTFDQNGVPRGDLETVGAVGVILSAPVIVLPPTNQVLAAGGMMALSIEVSGSEPLHYQWFKNGAMVSGGNSDMLTWSNATVTDSGVYTVAVTNAFGMRISTPVSVTVGTPQLLAWGNNDHGQLGDGTTNNRSQSFSVASNVVGGAAGYQHSLFVKGDGTLWATGDNGYGQLGDGTATGRSHAVCVASNVVSLAAGEEHSLFLTSDGTLRGMGYNFYGQLVDGSVTNWHTPVVVTSNVVSLAAGARHSLFVKNDGTLWTMGRNSFGQLGDGTTTDRKTPVFVASNVVAIAAGYYHSLFLTSDGTLWGMGQNNYGQLGDGTWTDRHSPVSVVSNVTALATGAWHSLFVTGDGSLWATGHNGYGQLGDGSTANKSNAIFIASNVTVFGAGYGQTQFVQGDSAMWAMGANSYGQAGDGTTTYWHLLPVPVSGMRLASLGVGSESYHTLAVGELLPPVITCSPATQTAIGGSNVTFTVAASGFAPLAYQWYFNDAPISGAIATNYNLTGVTASNAGNYTVVVSNSGGSVTSGVAVLTFVKAHAEVALEALIQTYDGASKSVTAFTVPSGLTVLMTYNGFAAAPTEVGTYAVTGTVSDVNWQGSASGTLIVKASQSINFASLAPQPLAAAVGLSATASSGLPVSFSVLSGPGTITGNTNLTFSAVGIVVVAASQAGDAIYGAAPDITNRVAVYAVSPDSGPLAGGNTVILSIGVLGAVTGVQVGGAAAVIQANGPDGLTLTIPAIGSAGIKDIVVQTSDNADFTLTGSYTVNPAGSIGGSKLEPRGWEGFGSGLSGHSVTALALDGSNLYAGGDFTTAGGVAANRVARWNGNNWTNLGSGLSGTAVYALAHDGVNLYAGGDFTNAGGVVANNVAMWNGTVWTNLGSGMNGTVRALALDGQKLYAGGSFTNAGGVAANYVALWNGTVWTNLDSGVDSGVRALAHDGTNLYAGGAFTSAGTTEANHIARWNGMSWTALGSGVDDTVRALTLVGPNVVAGGDFTTAGDKDANAVALWNGTSWEALGSGMNDSVTALAQDGANLYAGGYFTAAGGSGANAVALWDGMGWQALGSGMSSAVKALVHDGTNLIAGGDFTVAGGVPVNRVAVWGETLVAVSGVEPASGALAGGYTVTISGADLCNGSDVTGVTLCGISATVLSQSATQIVVTAGTALSTGSGDVRVHSTHFGETIKPYAFTYLANQTVSFAAIAPQPRAATIGLAATASSGLPVSFRVVSGPGGITDQTNLTFSAAGVVVVAASQSGDAFYGVAPDVIKSIYVYTVIPDNGPFAGGNSVIIYCGTTGMTTNVYVGGVAATIQGIDTNRLTLTIPATGSAGVKDIRVQTSVYGDFTLSGAYTVNPTGQIGGNTPGPNVWTGLGDELSGSFILALVSAGTNLYGGGSFTIAGVEDAAVAAWRGTNWSVLGEGPDDTVTALAYDGTYLYAGGYFTTAGGVQANYVARWDGMNWSSLGSGMDGSVSALVCAGGKLYAGGSFTTAGGVAANRVAMWNGTSWVGLGSGIVGSSVTALAHDGTNLYAGGYCTTIGGVTANRVVMWNGASWMNLGSSMNGAVYSLTWSGTHLYAGGDFTTVGGRSANRVARWDGAEWTSLGSGLNDTVRALVYAGTNLYVGGAFTTAGGAEASRVARWDGSCWSALGSGMEKTVRALAHDGTNLYVGGVFAAVDGSTSRNVTIWQPTVITHASVTPSSGPSSGGYQVVISGVNLCNGSDVTNVTLCGISASVLSQSATQIVVTAGEALLSGIGDVRVYSAGYGETVRADAFTYLAAPLIWNPQVQSGSDFGVRSNQFGFTISGTANLVVVIEACTNLVNPIWIPLETNTLTDGVFYFSDPAWTNYPARFYHLRQP